jgi:hypothetical protein
MQEVPFVVPSSALHEPEATGSLPAACVMAAEHCMGDANIGLGDRSRLDFRAHPSRHMDSHAIK